ncbi:MAG: hypothetical protein MRY83_18750 [Flavobacteriales bacterium]|nr:hypothetical protein [Flavobacteriales bacterium]
MSKFKFTVFLEQHTPIIHFQHDQEGATLRATEVKPKLDRFIIEKEGDWEKVDSSWKIGSTQEGHEALDYKIRIEPLSPPVIKDIDKRFPTFFANMGEDKGTIKKFSWADRGLHLTIFSFNTDLVKIVKDNIQDFFALHNFGTRQSKGFGSFMTSDGESTLNNHYPYSFRVASSNIQTVFETIDLFYKSIRGGINGASLPGRRGFTKRFYLKPMIFLYAAFNGMEWEKKAIKSSFPNFKRNLESQKQAHGYNMADEEENSSPLFYSGKQRIVRDLLGLSSEQSWKGYGRGSGATVTKKHIDKEGNNIKEDNAIARFKSPIQFKPLINRNGKSYTVYFRQEPIPKEFLEAYFAIEEGSNQLNLPVWKDFNLEKFLEFAFQEGRLENAININRSQDYDRKS